MEIVPIPLMDRARVAGWIDHRKTNLLAAMARDQAGALGLVGLFFRHLAPVAAARFGGPAALLLWVCSIRHHRPGNAEHAPPHIDATFFPPGGDGLTFWCPLDVVGETAPGVTFHTPNGECTPRVGPGQALVVPPDIPHHTQRLDGERVSVEFRCAPAKRLPLGLSGRIAVLNGGPDRRLLIAPPDQLVHDGLCARHQTIDGIV